MSKVINKSITITLIFLMIFSFANIFFMQNNVSADSNRYTYDGNNLNTGLYPGFKEKIDELKKAHPNWNFVIMETGLDWNQTIVAETAGHWGSPLSLIQGKNGDWICATCGTHAYDNGSWYHASEYAIKYYMDARNWLNDNGYLFQFLQLDYTETSDDNVYKALNGTFLNDWDIAVSINRVCRAQNMNPFYVISRIMQEQGSDGRGAWKITSEGVTYYNLFNIGASGNSTQEIINNSLATAKAHGWTSIEKSIEGGTSGTLKDYINRKQNTLYLNKFDVESYRGLYTMQYMQNIEAPKSEALSMYNKIKDANLLNQNLTFVIPVYYNMSGEISTVPENNVETGPKNIRLKVGHSEYNVREGRSTSSKSLTKVANHDTIVLSAQRYSDGWHRVVLTDGTAGYVKFDPNAWEEINDITNCNETVTLIGDQVNLRAGPKTSEAVITTLSKGQIVTRIDNSGRYSYDGITWDRVVLADGRQGFVSRQYLNNNNQGEILTIKADGGLNLRETPNGNVIRILSNDTKVTRIEIGTEQINGNYWDKIITPDGATGYVARSYLRDENGNVPNGRPQSDNNNVRKDDDSKTVVMEPLAEVSNVKTLGNNVTVTKQDGTAVTEGPVGTGYKINIDGTEFVAVKKGDNSGDGIIDSMDLYLMIQYMLDNKTFNEYEKKATDLDGNNEVDSMDMYLIIQHMLGNRDLNI